MTPRQGQGQRPAAEGSGAARLRMKPIPRTVWALGLVSLCMDLSSELVHALLPVYMTVVLGASTQEKINAAVLDLEPVNETAGFRQSGILGGNFLKYFRVTFDFQRGVIRLEPTSQIRKTDSAKPEQM